MGTQVHPAQDSADQEEEEEVQDLFEQMNNQAESASDDASPQQLSSPDFYSNVREEEQPAAKIKEPPKPKKPVPVRIKQPPPVTGQIKDLY